MIGSRLLGQQPTFGGADFGIPEIALFGYYQFRSAVPGVIVLQSCKGDLSIERWSTICQMK